MKDCKNCGKDISDSHFNKLFCSTLCLKDFELKKIIKKSIEENPENYVECKICGFRAPNVIFPHIINRHKINKKKYLEMHPNEKLMTDTYIEFLSEKVSKEKNPGFNHGGKLSPWSKNFKKYKNEEEYHKNLKSLKKKSSESLRNNKNCSNQIQYWVKQGFTEEESKIKVTERQKTFSKESCIKKYGEEVGLKKWQERQTKWQNNLNSKSKEEKEKINNSKSFDKEKYISQYGEEKYLLFRKTQKYKLSKQYLIDKFGEDEATKIYQKRFEKQLTRCSKVSQKLFWEIFNLLPTNLKEECYFQELNGEFKLFKHINSKLIFLDFVLKNSKKCIEFNGDFWHANPKLYESENTLYFNKKAKDIWEYDKQRLNSISNRGFDVLIIWERDYYDSPKETIERCVNYLIN